MEDTRKEEKDSTTPGEEELEEVKGGLIVVSNRLPITCKKTIEITDQGRKKTVWQFTRSSGGLVAALSGVKTSFTWIGWPGIHVKKESEKKEVLYFC